MKKAFLSIFGILLLFKPLLSQVKIIDFEENREWIEISNEKGGLWTIGKPMKNNFVEAYSTPNVIITDTNNYYPINKQASFIIKLPVDAVLMPDFYSFQMEFQHKYETDKANDGGFIEISYDKGNNWTNIILDTQNLINNDWCEQSYFGCLGELNFLNGYTKNDTIKGGIPAFSGISTDWKEVFINRGYSQSPNVDTIFIRFVFNCDEIQDEYSGWMIDDIKIWLEYGPVSISQSDIDQKPSIYPNPITENSILKLPDNKQVVIDIYNSVGTKLYSSKTQGINRSKIPDLDYKRGIYLCKVTNNEKSIIIKFIVK